MLIVVGLLWKELLYATFDPLGAGAAGLRVVWLEYLFLVLIALTIVISLQAVGIILVVAMLITPAATAQLLTQRFRDLVGAAVLIGAISPVVGLYISYWANTASGATIVMVETAVFLVALAGGSAFGAAARHRAVPRAGLTGTARPRRRIGAFGRRCPDRGCPHTSAMIAR